MTAMTGFANLYNCPVQYNGLPDSGPSTNGHSSTNIDIGTQLEGGREGGRERGKEGGKEGGREGGRLNRSIDHIINIYNYIYIYVYTSVMYIYT